MDSCVINYRDNGLKDFSINSNKELVFKLFDNNANQWSDEKRIDYGVVEFKLDVDVKGNIHIVYADNKGLKYAIISEEDFKRTTLFNYNKKYYKMENIKFLINKGRVDIITTLYDSGNENKRTLVHYERTSNGSKSKIISEFEFKKNEKLYYDAVYHNNMIKIFLNRSMGKENEVYLTKYLDEWSEPERVYSYNGKVKDFIVRDYQKGYVIFKVSREYSLNVISREIFDESFNMIERSRYSSSERISDPLLVVEGSEIWGFWKEKGQILGGNLTEEVILPRRISGSSGTIKMDYIVYKDGKIQRQNLFGINDPRKPFLLKEVFNEEIITWKFEEEFYKGKEEIIDKLFNELKKRELNIVELMKKGREVETLAKDRDGELRDLADRHRRLMDQNKSMTERVKGINSYRDVINGEKRELEKKLKDATSRNMIVEEDFKKLIAEKRSLAIEKQELLVENKNLKESIKVKEFMIKDSEELQQKNKLLTEKIEELQIKMKEIQDKIKEISKDKDDEKDRYLREIEGLNKILNERKDIEKLLNNIDANKNEGFFKKIFKIKE